MRDEPYHLQVVRRQGRGKVSGKKMNTQVSKPMPPRKLISISTVHHRAPTTGSTMPPVEFTVMK